MNDPARREQDARISDVVATEQPRLRNFVRRRVADPGDVEDILQDVFSALVEANRRLMPIEHITGWLYQAARNRITDLFRKKRPEGVERFDDVLPSLTPGPEAAYARTVLLDALETALLELPKEQREVFIAHEFGRRSFKELSAESGVGVNTLLSRKHYAVRYLRKRLQDVYDDFLDSRS